MKNDKISPPGPISVQQMARMLQLSRSRLYSLISEGILYPPVHLLRNRRPFYTRELAQRNLELKQNNVGRDGQVVIFYSPRKKDDVQLSKPKSQPKSKPRKKQSQNTHDDLIEALAGLGIINIKDSQINEAIATCYPDGHSNIDEGELIQMVFKYLMNKNTPDNEAR